MSQAKMLKTRTYSLLSWNKKDTRRHELIAAVGNCFTTFLSQKHAQSLVLSYSGTKSPTSQILLAMNFPLSASVLLQNQLLC